MVIVGGYRAYSAELLQKNNIGVLLKRVHMKCQEHADDDVDYLQNG
jgi:hypothetical protein